VQPDHVRDERGAGDEACAGGSEPAGQPAGCARAGEPAYVGAELRLVTLGERLEASLELQDDVGIGALLRPVDPAASTNVVVTSQATSTSAPWRSKSSASSAPRPPSVVAEPPTATMIRTAPSSSAARRSWPVP
jgi:hypothetical protein